MLEKIQNNKPVSLICVVATFNNFIPFTELHLFIL